MPNQKSYYDLKGILLCANENKTLLSPAVKSHHGVALAGGDAIDKLSSAQLVVAGLQSHIIQMPT